MGQDPPPVCLDSFRKQDLISEIDVFEVTFPCLDSEKPVQGSRFGKREQRNSEERRATEKKTEIMQEKQEKKGDELSAAKTTINSLLKISLLQR